MFFPTVASRRTRIGSAGLIIALLFAGVPQGAAQAPGADLPFTAGEVLSYRAVSSRFGSFGTGTLRVDGPEDVRGESTYRLSFDFRGRVALFGIQDQTRSWLTRDGSASLRYHKRERSPLGSRTEEVEIYPDERRWQTATGSEGRTTTPEPLDELSFLYFLRSLPLRDGDEYTLLRHFDPARNPVVVRVLGRERVEVPAGEFDAIVIEMCVRDERVSARDGAMRLYLTDDEARIPVRIESSAPWVGTTRLVLESQTGVRLVTR